MSPQGPMLAVADDLPVDAYVDALLAAPAPDAAPVPGCKPASASTAAPVPAPAPTPPANEPAARLEAAVVRGIVAPAILLQDTAPPALPARAPSGQRWLRMAIGEDRYAVELLRVQEVVRVVPVTAVRGAVPSLLGVMNLRGRIVPVHDLGRWLRCGRVEPDERSRIVVLEHQDELVGLLVTAVTDVVTLDVLQIEPPTPGTRDRTSLGIARTPGVAPTVLLDARVVFD